MNLYLIANIFFCCCALAGSIYALVHAFKPGTGFYQKMIAAAVLCIFFQKLYEMVQILIIGEIPSGFEVGTIGTIGFFVFLFSADYGTLDSLMDDGSPALKKYRIIALLAPLVLVLVCVFIILSKAEFVEKLFACLEEAAMGAAAYFALKHLIIPKKYAVIFTSLRPYYVIILALAAIMSLENLTLIGALEMPMWVSLVLAVVLGLLILFLSPVLVRGVRKWKG